jgi:hypothetical protein
MKFSVSEKATPYGFATYNVNGTITSVTEAGVRCGGKFLLSKKKALAEMLELPLLSVFLVRLKLEKSFYVYSLISKVHHQSREKKYVGRFIFNFVVMKLNFQLK